MKITLLAIKLSLLAAAMGGAAAHGQVTNPLAISPGPFTNSLASLSAARCPEWFRDAKLGIWSHWGPQAVPMAGDEYARNLYEQGHPQYQHHLAKYGHPSTNGYKEIIQLWKAEKWEPDKLMALCQKAGAKYFVSLGVDHDNFFLWNSRIHKWNAVAMGPRRDVVGEWQKAAKKHGLRFGISEHLGASFTWFQPSHQQDTHGPFAGIPYDGADPKYEDLYHWPAEPGDQDWYSTNPRWQRRWQAAITELVDRYHPDLLYSDGAVPFGNEVGRGVIAHLYNSDPRRVGKLVQTVYTCKERSEGRWVEHLERGSLTGINPTPWQTDASIGDWYYNQKGKYRPASWAIHRLVDVVSKNGNLLLNIVQRPDGSLDPEVETVLQDLATWMAVNGESVHGTRPWLAYGEGPATNQEKQDPAEDRYTAQDVRFATKGSQILFATLMGWPREPQVTIRSLAQTAEATARIRSVKLLGYAGKLAWQQTAAGLTIDLPPNKPCDFAVVFKIACNNANEFRPPISR